MGEVFGPYEVLREIASGGMASVYEAMRKGEDGFARRVAIKRIHPHLAKSREFSEMFIDEARIAAQIDHPNDFDLRQNIIEPGDLAVDRRLENVLYFRPCGAIKPADRRQPALDPRLRTILHRHRQHEQNDN